MPTRERLDKLLVERGLAPTRAKAQAIILAGEVLVDGRRVTKAGALISLDANIQCQTAPPYVGRGGYKLAAAVDVFGLTLQDRFCADVGACTGGFTDVMLQAGAARVYAIDVGYGQLDWRLRQDVRVVVMERTNARYLTALPEPITFAAIDVSFISLQLILPVVYGWLTPASDVVALIKPQFEAGRGQVGRGGIVRDPTVQRAVVAGILTWARGLPLYTWGVLRSPITGSDGNVEFLAWLRLQPAADFDLSAAIDAAMLPTP